MKNFWHGKSVLLTGHTGFKGSWMSLWLQSLGANLVGYSLPPPTSPSLFELANVSSHMTSILGDIRDLNELQRVVLTIQPEIVIHMAAQPLVRYSYFEPVETYSTNVMGTVNLLQSLRQVNSVKAIVIVTTDKCYENKDIGTSFSEEDVLGGNDPYSNSKACAELVATAFRHSFFKTVGLATARAGNVIGGGDWASDRLVPDIIKTCINDSILQIRYPDALRPWQHVLEPLNGYLLLAENLYYNPSLHSEAWNFGPADKDIKPVSWIVEEVAHLWGGNIRWKHEKNEHLYEAKCLRLNCNKAYRKLNWHPHWDLPRGLKETVSWYHALQLKQDMRQFTLSQIKSFVEMPCCEDRTSCQIKEDTVEA